MRERERAPAYPAGTDLKPLARWRERGRGEGDSISINRKM